MPLFSQIEVEFEKRGLIMRLCTNVILSGGGCLLFDSDSMTYFGRLRNGRGIHFWTNRLTKFNSNNHEIRQAPRAISQIRWYSLHWIPDEFEINSNNLNEMQRARSFTSPIQGWPSFIWRFWYLVFGVVMYIVVSWMFSYRLNHLACLKYGDAQANYIPEVSLSCSSRQ
jgi:hypothetical protein